LKYPEIFAPKNAESVSEETPRPKNVRTGQTPLTADILYGTPFAKNSAGDLGHNQDFAKEGT